MDGRVLRLDGRVGVLGTGGQAEGRPVKTVADPFKEFQFRGLRWWWNLRVYPVPGSAAGSPWEDPCSEQWRQSVQGTGGALRRHFGPRSRTGAVPSTQSSPWPGSGVAVGSAAGGAGARDCGGSWAHVRARAPPPVRAVRTGPGLPARVASAPCGETAEQGPWALGAAVLTPRAGLPGVTAEAAVLSEVGPWCSHGSCLSERPGAVSGACAFQDQVEVELPVPRDQLPAQSPGAGECVGLRPQHRCSPGGRVRRVSGYCSWGRGPGLWGGDQGCPPTPQTVVQPPPLRRAHSAEAEVCSGGPLAGPVTMSPPCPGLQCPDEHRASGPCGGSEVRPRCPGSLFACSNQRG